MEQLGKAHPCALSKEKLCSTRIQHEACLILSCNCRQILLLAFSKNLCHKREKSLGRSSGELRGMRRSGCPRWRRRRRQDRRGRRGSGAVHEGGTAGAKLNEGGAGVAIHEGGTVGPELEEGGTSGLSSTREALRDFWGIEGGV